MHKLVLWRVDRIWTKIRFGTWIEQVMFHPDYYLAEILHEPVTGGCAPSLARRLMGDSMVMST